MNTNNSLTADEWRVFADHDFFLKKAAISLKLKRTLEQLHVALQPELVDRQLIAPKGFDPEVFQFVKGEHLESCPYQYLDFPRYYTRQDKLAFRSLCWWGHHLVFALIVEGPLVKQYRLNLFNRYAEVSDRQLSLCLSSSLWEWKSGPGFTLDITHHRRSEIAAALDRRTFFKIARCIPIQNLDTDSNAIITAGVTSFQSMLPIITR
ncbi:MAG: hypothetical protein OEZ57_07115 [Nitrospirota bacterium]|nr:hypothetical protein [Nitrospirota bacterium]MDH5587215.1 hypothetical protein [Nitrospirota bacterium]MDH5774668.1 hypothetical protein [Nitrospirota bacterium]